MISGLHLLNVDDETLDWTAGNLGELGRENIIGAHGPGIEPVFTAGLVTGRE